ncbi:hypothetical protein EK21DRAFT_78658 [Setomelanomma holmii]|uniref:Heterokaryon incompatibility domain-containing protein n=1 Tax=Setomelanomma holmii TaxID=210430 RepID=A0A9P4GWY5_9PLEO|nr:hypothetical protein EK21DRAFT_78658 [Setomelanomma holmii]
MGPALERQVFAYQPLNVSQQSIRLIRVLPELSTEYSCLSYVWGSPSDRRIEIAGQQHLVRDNLLAFLQVARSRGISKWLWIDALCIDQNNVKERTRQVRLMGSIFSHAIEVISWVGPDESIAEFLRDSPQKDVLTRTVAISFFSSDYLLCAWIIQEIILARRGMLMAGDVELAVSNLPQFVTIEASWNYIGLTLKCYTSSHQGAIDEDARGRTLLWLLGRFRYKRCAVSRDRVFSFLGLCSNGADTTIDYSTTNEEVAYDIISKCLQSLCLCTTGIVCEALDIAVKPGILPEWKYFTSEPWTRIFAQVTLPVVSHFEPSRG